jgi:hypothetical protein
MPPTAPPAAAAPWLAACMRPGPPPVQVGLPSSWDTCIVIDIDKTKVSKLVSAFEDEAPTSPCGTAQQLGHLHSTKAESVELEKCLCVVVCFTVLCMLDKKSDAFSSQACLQLTGMV